MRRRSRALEHCEAYVNDWHDQDSDPTAYTIRRLCNEFQWEELKKVESQKMKERTGEDYKAICKVMVSVWGPKKPVANLKPEDFGPPKSGLSVGQDGKSVRPKTVHNLISRCRTY